MIISEVIESLRAMQCQLGDVEVRVALCAPNHDTETCFDPIRNIRAGQVAVRPPTQVRSWAEPPTPRLPWTTAQVVVLDN